MTALLVSVLVFAAGLLAGSGHVSRLRRLAAPDDSSGQDDDRPRSCGGGRCARRGEGRPWTSKPRRARAAAEAVRTVGELAALLRAGVPAVQVWAHLPARCRGGDTGGPRGLPACAPQGHAGWNRLLLAADLAAREGGSVAAVLRAGAAECGPEVSAVVRSLAAAWEVSERTGAAAAGVLDRLADGLRADEDARAARAVAMAGPRATAKVLAWMPALGLALGQLVGADPLTVLLVTPLGRACGALGAVLAMAAVIWTRRLVRIAESAA